LLELDTTKGRVQLGLGVGSLFASGLAAAAPLLLASLAVTAAGNAWDTSPAGQQGAVARIARSVAAVSVTTPVTVIIDGADRLNPDLASAMIENLVSRYDGHVLVVATITPGSQLREDLHSHTRYGLLGRVLSAEADPDMSAEARAALVHELCPLLPDAVIQRIARRTTNFGEIFAVSAAEKLGDLSAETNLSALNGIDAIINATVAREEVSAEAKVVAWAGGAMINRQADKALQILGASRKEADSWVIQINGIARLCDPASPRVREQVDVLASDTKRALAVAVMEEAASVASDSDATLIERTVARTAVHRIRVNLPASSELTSMQCALIRGLERLGDPTAAYDVAAVALAELPADGQPEQRRTELLKAWLRLARIQPRANDDPFTKEAINLAITNGALLGLEAQVWAAVNLLHRPRQRCAALELTGHIITELAKYHSRDPTGNQWRLLLAFHLGQVGYPGPAHRLLSPMINGGTTQQQEAAQAVLRAVDGPRADTRLQIIILEAELAATHVGMDDEIFQLLRTLADDYSDLGDYRKALDYGSGAFDLSSRLNGKDHPLTLVILGDIAYWTGQSGDYTESLRLFQALLPKQARVMGPAHPHVLGTRGDIAY
jgi:Tetratricopeptide repeat